MSAHQPPANPPVNPPVDPPPRKYRPSAGWFVLGIGLLLAGAAVTVGAFVWLLAGFFQNDVRVQADGQPRQVTVDTGGDRLIWVEELDRVDDCQVVDRATGEAVTLRTPRDEFRRNLGRDRDWIGTLRFDPGSGDLEVTCTSTSGLDWIEIGPAPQLKNFAVGVVVATLVGGGLGILGFVVLIVTGVLWSLREPRPKGA